MHHELKITYEKSKGNIERNYFFRKKNDLTEMVFKIMKDYEGEIKYFLHYNTFSPSETNKEVFIKNISITSDCDYLSDEVELFIDNPDNNINFDYEIIIFDTYEECINHCKKLKELF
jgi:hypothetical protein